MKREAALKRYERYLATINKWFPVLEKWFPVLAHRFAYRLFFRPFKFPTPPKEQAAIKQATLSRLKLTTETIQVYSWGKGPIVVFVHGWAGRGTQVFKFIPEVLKLGYQVVTFDAPGHGQSTGKYSDVSLFSESIKAIQKQFGDIYALMGHSLGGGAALLAITEGLLPEKVIVISSPSIAPEIMKDFIEKIGASQDTASYLEVLVFEKHGRTLEDFSAHNSAKHMPTVDTLLVYDEDDIDVPLYHGEDLRKILPQSEMLVTKGLGHTRILRSDEVISQVASFLGKKSLL